MVDFQLPRLITGGCTICVYIYMYIYIIYIYTYYVYTHIMLYTLYIYYMICIYIMCIYTLYTQSMENYYSTYDYHDPLCHASHDTSQVEFDLSMKARSVSTVSLRWCRSYRCSWDSGRTMAITYRRVVISHHNTWYEPFFTMATNNHSLRSV